MSKQYDEKDMPNVADAYDDLETMVLDHHVEIELALDVVTDKYSLTQHDRARIMGWLQDEILTLEGDADGQVSLDQDH